MKKIVIVVSVLVVVASAIMYVFFPGPERTLKLYLNAVINKDTQGINRWATEELASAGFLAGNYTLIKYKIEDEIQDGSPLSVFKDGFKNAKVRMTLRNGNGLEFENEINVSLVKTKIVGGKWCVEGFSGSISPPKSGNQNTLTTEKKSMPVEKSNSADSTTSNSNAGSSGTKNNSNSNVSNNEKIKQLSFDDLSIYDTEKKQTFKLGMTQSEVEEMLGKSEEQIGNMYAYNNGKLNIGFRDSKVVFILSKDSRYETSRGIKVGDKTDKILKLYGNNVQKQYEEGERTGPETPYQERQTFNYVVYKQNGEITRLNPIPSFGFQDGYAIIDFKQTEVKEEEMYMLDFGQSISRTGICDSISLGDYRFARGFK
ncbi:hypothetical protein HQN89_20970 [Paenibacillus frigoriresistens]|uniref:hypothetical protein n=1 Tax=Paenibacillus alginolyticus TaxID=59839 RepID=UPI001564312B|nr:hypothetical protein [Paenibacillus frigoriresistens]NRF93424.1 hypothetical protein [Paenibacillus frigoriresistens]